MGFGALPIYAEGEPYPMRDPLNEFVDAIRSAVKQYDDATKPPKKEKYIAFTVTQEDQEDSTMSITDFSLMLKARFGFDCVNVAKNHRGTRITIREDNV